MAVFVHLTSQRNIPAIRRSGIGRARRSRGSGRRFVGVYAMPVTRNFYVSHQWLRELRRWGAGTMVGVYFRLPDDQPVMVGHYNSPHVDMTAAEAVALMMGIKRGAPARARKGKGSADEKARSGRESTPHEGWEVIIPRRIDVSEILRVKALPQVVGWRYMPGANGQPPCTCLCCGGRGTYGIRKLLRAVELSEATGKPTKVAVFGRGDDSFRRVERLKRQRPASRAQTLPSSDAPPSD